MKLRFICKTASRRCAMAKRKKGNIHVSLYGAFIRGTFDEDSTMWLNAISMQRWLWKNFPRLMAYRLSLNSSAVNERRGGAYTINRTKAAIAFSTHRIIPSRRRNRVYALYNLYTRRRREHPCEKLRVVPVASEVQTCVHWHVNSHGGWVAVIPQRKSDN